MDTVWWKIAKITALATAVSVIMTGGALLLFSVQNIVPSLAMAIVCPLAIAPMVSRHYLRQADEIEQLCAQLSEANLALTETSARLRDIARRDGLTGLLNRTAFFETAQARCAVAGGSMLMIDADHFKQINDRHGHAAGDAALIAIAEAIATSTGGSAAGRLGGEEFAVFLAGMDAPEAAAAADRVRRQVEALRLAGEREPFGVTVSVGIASASAGVSVEALYRAADGKLLEAKQAGRNRSMQLGEKIAA